MPPPRLLPLSCLVLVLGASCGKKSEQAAPPPTAAPADAITSQAPPPADATPAAAPADAAAAAEPDAAVAVQKPIDPGPNTEPKPNTGPMKDLQVLSKKMSRKEVEAYMKNDVAKALGVKCSFCHVKDDYAAPHEHKTVAREMMKMTNDISKSFFDGKPRVTCFTCHQGKAEP